MNTTAKKILILSANPKDTNKLRLDEEVREIQAALKLSNKRYEFEIITQLAITNYYYRDTKVVSVESTEIVSDENIPCPYRGLFHFGPDDAEFFFGREVFVEELFEATQNRNFIPVLGASGSGKSSVVLAGLVPTVTGCIVSMGTYAAR